MALPRQYVLSRRVQALLSGINSPSLANATINMTFSTSDVATLPSNPTTAIRRSLLYSKFESTEYDCFTQLLDGSGDEQLTSPR